MSRKSKVEDGGRMGRFHAFLPPRGEYWTGFCRSAKEAQLAVEKAGGSAKEALEAALRHSSHCRGAFLMPGGEVRHCKSPFHGNVFQVQPRDLDLEIRQARHDRALASGRSAVSVDKVTGKRTKEVCKHQHPMTPENTGPRGICRACKRIASQRFKERAQGLPESEWTPQNAPVEKVAREAS